MNSVSRREWYGALQFYPVLFADAYLTGQPEEKIIKSADLGFLEVQPSRFPDLTKMKVQLDDKQQDWFLNWLRQIRDAGARRAFAAPLSAAKENEKFQQLARPFTLVIEFPKRFESWRLYQACDRILWQLNEADSREYFDSAIAKNVRSHSEKYISNSEYIPNGSAGFWQEFQFLSATASMREYISPHPNRSLSWLDSEIRTEALKLTTAEQKAWDRWSLEYGLAYSGWTQFFFISKTR